VAGHHRAAAAKAAGLEAVPCWVREMDDEEAFLELVKSNNQSELSPLEHGEHALKATKKGKHGKSVEAYAEAIGRPITNVKREVHAARVAQSVPRGTISPTLDRTRHLAELHAAAAWLWPVLVARMLSAGWNVETARTNAGRLNVPRVGRSRTVPAMVSVGQASRIGYQKLPLNA
jgi:ParB-like chromosome segregation protein Spo0J